MRVVAGRGNRGEVGRLRAKGGGEPLGEGRARGAELRRC